MKTLLLLLPLLLVGCAAKNPVTPVVPVNGDWTITLNWTQDFTNETPCGTAKVGCITSFTWGYISNGAPITLKTSPVSVCSGSAQPETCTDTTNATVGIGNVTPFAITNGFDNSGNAVSSSSVSGPPQNVPITSAVVVGMSLK